VEIAFATAGVAAVAIAVDVAVVEFEGADSSFRFLLLIVTMDCCCCCCAGGGGCLVVEGSRCCEDCVNVVGGRWEVLP
jgi:hypothetical protein